MTLGLPSAWVWPWVLISDSSIRKNFSASMAVSHSLVFRRCNATEPRFQAVFAEVQNGFFAWMICFVAFLSAKPDHGIVRAGDPGQRTGGLNPKLQGNLLSEAYGLTVILRPALTVAWPIVM